MKDTTVVGVIGLIGAVAAGYVCFWVGFVVANQSTILAVAENDPAMLAEIEHKRARIKAGAKPENLLFSGAKTQ